MTASDDVPKIRLKIKFSFKNADLLLKSGSSEVRKQTFMNEDCAQNISVDGNRGSTMKKSHEAAPHASDSLILYGADSSNVASPGQSSRKRGLLRVIDSAMNKRQKMDPSLKQHCGSILEALIKHPAALGFSEPVDPIKFNIPDYFSVVSSPMDLGTVRSKLQNDMYFSTEEFKDDVRLTFSNAMLYNPSDNIFNRNAKKLDGIFNTKLKSLDARLKCESMNPKQNSHSSGRERKTTETKYLCRRRSSVHSGLAPTISMSTEDKRKLTEEFVVATRPKIRENLMILNTGAANQEPAKNIQNSRSPGDKILQKGIAIGSRSTCRTAKTMPSASMVATRCSSCGSLECHCCPLDGYACAASSRDLASERHMGQNCDGSKMEHGSGLISDACKSDPESDGAVSVLDEQKICSSPQTSIVGTTGVAAEGWTTDSDLQLSPKKALRAAMLKSRFVDTILKAKQKTLLDHVEKVDPVKFRQQKEKLERQQLAEKARIEAQIRAAEVASSLRAQEELRIRRERERDEARIALQKMEKTVEIDENLNILKEFDMFSRGSDKSLVPFEASQGGHLGNILEHLGLYMKDDYMDYEDEEEGLFLHDREEGLVCS
ncbi:transcription factor GTE10 isoform X1 [Daucus carota subsp. sativus]|uniref:transcription factor GTE10 isoform X1 n=1 Tax=Daucus carota subsp. sativus TaxID=79200 RepID=UPI0007B2592A|nr:PREDICTED: transcription factor GTE10-like isoform X1 [Daucus carota subsp. sativus]